MEHPGGLRPPLEPLGVQRALMPPLEILSSHQPAKSQALAFPAAQAHVSVQQQVEKRSRVDAHKPASWSPWPFRPIPVSGRHGRLQGALLAPATCTRYGTLSSELTGLGLDP